MFFSLKSLTALRISSQKKENLQSTSVTICVGVCKIWKIFENAIQERKKIFMQKIIRQFFVNNLIYNTTDMHFQWALKVWKNLQKI